MKKLIELYNEEIKDILSVDKVENILDIEREPLFVVSGASPMLIGTRHILYDKIEADTYIEYFIDKSVIEEKVDFIKYKCKILKLNKRSCVFNSEAELNLVKELVTLLDDILAETKENESYDNISIYTNGKNFTIITKTGQPKQSWA